jgi:hypothetical protein
MSIISAFDCRGSTFFLDRDGLQKLLLHVKTLDFKKIRAIYGISQELYIQTKHQRFGKCMTQTVVNENKKTLPHLAKKSNMYCVSVRATASKRSPWVIRVDNLMGHSSPTSHRLMNEKCFINFYYSFPQPVVNKMRVNAKVIGTDDIQLHIVQYTRPNTLNLGDPHFSNYITMSATPKRDVSDLFHYVPLILNPRMIHHFVPFIKDVKERKDNVRSATVDMDLRKVQEFEGENTLTENIDVFIYCEVDMGTCYIIEFMPLQ